MSPLRPLVPLSKSGTPLRGSADSTRRWIWSRRGYTGRTVKVFWDLRSHSHAWRGLEWRGTRDGRSYFALVPR